MQATLKLSEIKVENRLREDLGDIDGLAESIRRFGLIQPVIINQEKTLIAGGRRYAAHQRLGLESISVVYRETMSQDELHELELEENVRRKNMSWQEECLSIYEIYKLKRRRGALEGWTWNQRLASEAFGMKRSSFNYVIRVAEKLEAEKSLPIEGRRFWGFTSANEAFRLGILKDEEDRLQAELARRYREAANKGTDESHAKQLIAFVEEAQAVPDLLAAERLRYNSNPHNIVPFDTYWAEKTAQAKQLSETIYLTNRVIHGDSIAYMNKADNFGRFDHILTDIPYGIDLEMLNQQNPHGGLADLDTVIDEHNMEDNIRLIKEFYPAAYKCTKEFAFVITFADQMNWQLMHDCAVSAGFKVQRWPFIWSKPHAMNQCAQYNITKNFEIAIVARKPGATLASKLQSSIFQADNGQAVSETGHKFAKPYEVTEYLANGISIPGQEILEPFAGRGSIAIQLLKMQRRIVAVELQETHHNALMENIKKFYLKVNPNYQFK